MSSDDVVSDLRARLDKLLADLAKKEQQADFDADNEVYIQQLKTVVQLFIQHSPERKDELLEILAGLERTWN